MALIQQMQEVATHFNVHYNGVGARAGMGICTPFPIPEKLVHYTRVSDWLRDREKLKLLKAAVPVIRGRRGKTISSYKIKHVVETDIGAYVSNGEVIVLAAVAGLEIKVDGGINAVVKL